MSKNGRWTVGWKCRVGNVVDDRFAIVAAMCNLKWVSQIDGFAPET
jgi:hypothetical protein